MSITDTLTCGYERAQNYACSNWNSFQGALPRTAAVISTIANVVLNRYTPALACLAYAGKYYFSKVQFLQEKTMKDEDGNAIQENGRDVTKKTLRPLKLIGMGLLRCTTAAYKPLTAAAICFTAAYYAR